MQSNPNYSIQFNSSHNYLVSPLKSLVRLLGLKLVVDENSGDTNKD